MLTPFTPTPRKSPKYYTAICLFHKNENSYLQEFVDYHLSIGFDHVYIIDNGSEITPEATLYDYTPKYVTVDYYDDEQPKGKHGRAFSFFIKKYRKGNAWVAFIDTDEFLVPKKQQDIKAFLKDYENFGGVGVNMLHFGDSGLTERPSDIMQIEALTKCAAYDNAKNAHVKTIANMRHTRDTSKNPHWFVYEKSFLSVNEHKIPFVGPYSSPPSFDLIQLNHYWSRTFEEYRKKMERGGGNGLKRVEKMYGQYQKLANRNEDKSILKFVGATKSFARKNIKAPLVMALGLNKTGTRTLKVAFDILGWTPLHNPSRFNSSVEQALVEGKHPLKYLERYNMFTDIFYPFPNHGHPLLRIENREKFFDFLFTRYPFMKIIVNKRNVDSWLKSREKHVKRNVANAKYNGLRLEFDRQCSIDEYQKHYSALLTSLKRHNMKYLKWDLKEQDTFNDLCPFLEIDTPDVDFPHPAEIKKTKSVT